MQFPKIKYTQKQSKILVNITISLAVIIAFIVFSTFLLILKSYKKVAPGKAMLITGFRGQRVHFSPAIVIPFLEQMDFVDITLKKIQLSCEGNDALICKDGRKADMKFSFFIRVNPKSEDIKIVASYIGCERTFDLAKLSSIFSPRFLESAKAVTKNFEAIEIKEHTQQFKITLMNHINKSMNAYVLHDCTIDDLGFR